MDKLLLITAIIRNVALALSNPDIYGRDPAPWIGYLRFAAFLAETSTATAQELTVFNEQIARAVEEKRGLTPEERAAWRERDDVATSIAEDWLKDHPES